MRILAHSVLLCCVFMNAQAVAATKDALPGKDTTTAANKEKQAKKKDPLKRKKSERGPLKPLSEMTYEELKTEKKRLLSRSDDEGMMRCIEKMIPLANDPKELQEITLELADVLLRLDEYAKAQTMYADFVKFYPGSSRLEEASYHAIESCYKQILDYDRDQSKTEETITLAQTFLARSIFKEYRKEVVDIAHACNLRLWDHEEYIISHYMQQRKLVGAKKHIDKLATSLLPVLPDCELRLLAMQASYADATHKPAEAHEKRALIQAKLSKDPSLKQTPLVLAQASTGKHEKSFTQRF